MYVFDLLQVRRKYMCDSISKVKWEGCYFWEMSDEGF